LPTAGGLVAFRKFLTDQATHIFQPAGKLDTHG